MKDPKTTRTRKSNKYVFTLKNINTEKIDQKYGIILISNISQNIEQPTNTTMLTELSELNKNTSLDIVSFLDESKRLYQCNVSMINYSTGKSTEYLKYKCYWCRYLFDSIPIGCPISYTSSKAKKTYYSEVSKDNYSIRENITKYKKKLVEDSTLFMTKNKAQVKIAKEEFYSTDGIFCSFNCTKAFIKDNKHNLLYEHSDNLLIKLYIDMNSKDSKDSNNSNNIKINPAPHWRLLKDFGGHLAIEDFRENFNKCTYDFFGHINIQSLYKPVGMLFEEKINF